MKATKGFAALSGALVPAARAGHEPFVREKLVLLGLILAGATLATAFQGVPTSWEAALFAAALMPLAASLLAARAGRMALAHVVAIGGDIAIALLLASHVGAAAALPWLGLAGFEGALAFERTMAGRIALALLPVAAAILALDATAVPQPIVHAPAFAALCALAVASLSCWRFTDITADETPAPGSRARDEALVLALGDAVAIFDAGGLFLDTTTGCEPLLDADCDALSGRGFFDLVNVADRPAFLKLLGDAAHDGGVTHGTLRLRTSGRRTRGGGSREPRSLVLEVRAHRAGAEVVAILRDVTDARRREAEVDEAQRSVDEALRAKDHFLANMSHELRTPLNAIIGFSEMLASRTMTPAEPAKQREYAGIIHDSGQHLLSVVNSILDMSKIQSGTFSLLPEPFAIETLAEQCCDVVRLQAQNGRVAMIRDVPAELEEIVADRRACRQILTNLLSNAVKFTPERGRVTLTIRPEGTTLRISVGDTGIGIAEADLSRLGDPFFQARSSLSRPYEGTGLGLSVVRGLVGLHGGSIAIESEIGKGTVVTVRLPLDCRTAGSSLDTIIETVPRRGTVEPVRPSGARRPPDQRSSDTRKQSA